MSGTVNHSMEWVKKIAAQLVMSKQSNVWLDFTPYPFAIYDREWVYLHTTKLAPSGFTEVESNIYKGQWNQKFVGCTAIDYDGQLIAIWDQELISPTTSFEEMYASLLHEMFHCYQFEKGFFRMGNELLLVQYPFTEQNIAARLLERRYLLSAVFADDPIVKRQLISTFIALREQRREWIGEFMQYELVSESNEGTAVYVECKTRQSITDLPPTYLLAKYGRDLIEIPNDLKMFRASCYSSGLYIALFLDTIAPNWKGEYKSSTQSLYDLLLKHFNPIDVILPKIDTQSATYIIEQDRQRRALALQEFFHQEGYQVTLRGRFKIAGIDPMNMLRYEDHIVHSHFLKISHKDLELFLSGLSVVHVQENLWATDEVQLYTTEAPKVDDEQISISGVGEFIGHTHIEGNHYIIDLK